MKRYNMIYFWGGGSKAKESPNGEWIRYENILAVKRPDGEWVKYEDVESELSRITEIYEKRIRELKDQIGPGIKMPECNCVFEGQRRSALDIYGWWICPAHGYKKR